MELGTSVSLSPSVDIGKDFTEEDFLNLSAKNACLYAYKKYSKKDWTLKNFDNALRLWWRKNHPQTIETAFDSQSPSVEMSSDNNLVDIVSVVESVFGSSS